MQMERVYTLNQGGKIIDRIIAPEEYKEDSNVICYYVFTAALMNNYLIFLQWCEDINKKDKILKFNNKPKNIENFTDLIIEKLDDNEFRNMLECVNSINLQSDRKSLRMSLI